MGAKKTTTKTTDSAVVDSAAAVVLADEKEAVSTSEKASKKSTKATSTITEPLNDSDEIEVISLIPNVSYWDSKTNDMYEWEKVGHVEYMTFETLKNMRRNHRTYFTNLWLKPMDNRVIKQFGLTNTYTKYEFLMDESNYTRAKIKNICDAIATTPNGLKYAICNKVKDLVVSGKVTDINVIATLEKQLNLDLVSLLSTQ